MREYNSKKELRFRNSLMRKYMSKFKSFHKLKKYFLLKIFEYLGNEDIKNNPELHYKKREYITSLHDAIEKVLHDEKLYDGKTVRLHNDNKNESMFNYFVFVGNKPIKYEGFTKKDIGIHLEGDSLDKMILRMVNMNPPHGVIREFEIKNDYDYIFAKLITCDIVRKYITIQQNKLKYYQR
jgi:hypothetical protein